MKHAEITLEWIKHNNYWKKLKMLSFHILSDANNPLRESDFESNTQQFMELYSLVENEIKCIPQPCPDIIVQNEIMENVKAVQQMMKPLMAIIEAKKEACVKEIIHLNQINTATDEPTEPQHMNISL